MSVARRSREPMPTARAIAWRATARAAVSALALAIAGCSGWDISVYPAKRGLRWTGDATVAGARDGTALGGPAVRFRAGRELAARPRTDGGKPAQDGAADWLVGSWGGLELSAAVLTGAAAGGRAGTLALFGFRPWLSRRQDDWFLGTERISLLGAMIPDVGVAYGLGAGTRFRLGWELPLGSADFQIVPGVSWISPGGAGQALGTIAFRVPM
jgi:hypothetical protein